MFSTTPLCFGALTAAVALLLAASADAKLYSRCELAAALKAKGIPIEDIATWVCIGERLSSIETDTATDPDDDPDGTVYHGVFLISGRWWCDRGKAGCGVTCSKMKETLASNIDCAKKVFAETKRLKKDGFKAWGAYDDCQEPGVYTETCADLVDGDPDGGQGEDTDVSVWQRQGVVGRAAGRPGLAAKAGKAGKASAAEPEAAKAAERPKEEGSPS